MNSEQAYQLLHQVMYLNPIHTPSESSSTFLVVEMARHETEHALHISTVIVDPSMPDCGDAVAYLELDPIQRLALELSEIVQVTAPGIASVVRHAPLDEELCERTQNNKSALANVIRAMVTKAAVLCIEDALPAQKGTIQ